MTAEQAEVGNNVMLMAEFHLPYEYFEAMDPVLKAKIRGVVEARQKFRQYQESQRG